MDVLLLQMFCESSSLPWVGLLCVIVVFPDHTHLLFDPDFTDLVIWNNLISGSADFV